MKKRITASGTLRNVPVRQRCIGIDVDSRIAVTAFLDVNAEYVPIREYTNDRPGLAGLVKASLEFEPEIVVLESTGQYSLPVYDALIEGGLFAVVVNPMSIKALLRADGAKTDRLDSVTLARCGAMFPRLRWSNMPDHWQREVRVLFRLHDEATLLRRATSARMGAQLRQCGVDVQIFGAYQSQVRWKIIRALTTDDNAQHADLHPQRRGKMTIAEHLDGIAIPSAVLRYRDRSLQVMDEAAVVMEEQLVQLEQVLQEPRTAEAVKWMLTVPCTSPLTALRVVSEFGRNFTERYTTCRAFCAASGLAPRTEITGGRVVALADSPGRKRFLIAFIGSLKGHLRTLPRELDLWLGTYERRGATYSKRLLALGHQIGKGWYNCTKLEKEFDAAEAVGRRLSYRVDQVTGEIIYHAP